MGVIIFLIWAPLVVIACFFVFCRMAYMCLVSLVFRGLLFLRDSFEKKQ